MCIRDSSVVRQGELTVPESPQVAAGHDSLPPHAKRRRPYTAKSNAKTRIPGTKCTASVCSWLRVRGAAPSSPGVERSCGSTWFEEILGIEGRDWRGTALQVSLQMGLKGHLEGLKGHLKRQGEQEGEVRPDGLNLTASCPALSIFIHKGPNSQYVVA
eukprot:1652321-Rhodomonas_salina.1